MALLRHRREGPRFPTPTARAMGVREPPGMTPASDEIRQVLVVRHLKPQGETAFHHTDTARRTLLRRYAPRSLASPETPVPARRVTLRLRSAPQPLRSAAAAIPAAR